MGKKNGGINKGSMTILPGPGKLRNSVAIAIANDKFGGQVSIAIAFAIVIVKLEVRVKIAIAITDAR